MRIFMQRAVQNLTLRLLTGNIIHGTTKYNNITTLGMKGVHLNRSKCHFVHIRNS